MRILWINHRDPRHPEAGSVVHIREIRKRLVDRRHKITLLAERLHDAPTAGVENKNNSTCCRCAAPQGYLEVNDENPMGLIEMAEKALGSSDNKGIAALGLSFEPNADDMREAVSRG